MLTGEVRIESDVPVAYAEIVTEELERTASQRNGAPFRLAASGGNSGAACCVALASSATVDLTAIDLFFADERCVEEGSSESNQLAISAALGSHRAELAGFHPMSCALGAKAYEAELWAAGGLDLVQLGLGPDGHTASLFPGSKGLAVDDALVCSNVDPSGRNPHRRLTLTYQGIALAPLVVVSVIGAARAEIVRAIADGNDCPASRVRAERIVWLIDTAAAKLLEGSFDA